MHSVAALLCALAGASAAPPPSQVLVLGPHHSATSIASKALSLLGLYLGEREDLLLDASNPLKFWERRDVVDINRQRLKAGVAKASDAMPPFVGYGFDPAASSSLWQASDAQKAAAAKRAVIEQLNEHRPWAIKDPRLSLLASEWLPHMDPNAVCVLTVRATLRATPPRSRLRTHAHIHTPTPQCKPSLLPSCQ